MPLLGDDDPAGAESADMKPDRRGAGASVKCESDGPDAAGVFFDIGDIPHFGFYVPLLVAQGERSDGRRIGQGAVFKLKFVESRGVFGPQRAGSDQPIKNPLHRHPDLEGVYQTVDTRFKKHLILKAGFLKFNLFFEFDF